MSAPISWHPSPKSSRQGHLHLPTLVSLEPMDRGFSENKRSQHTSCRRRLANGRNVNNQAQPTITHGINAGEFIELGCCFWRRQMQSVWMPMENTSAPSSANSPTKLGGWWREQITGWDLSSGIASAESSGPSQSSATQMPARGVPCSPRPWKTRSFGTVSWLRQQPTLWLARPKDTPGKSSRPSAPSSPKQSPRGSPKKKQKGPKRYTGEDKSAKGPDGHYTVNRRGVEICRLYGEGKCGSKAAQGRCKNGRSHQCSLCLGPHMSSECQGKQPGNWPSGSAGKGGQPAGTKRKDPHDRQDNPKPKKAARSKEKPEEPKETIPEPKPAPREDDCLFPVESDPPRKYGYWSCSSNRNFEERPKALVIFAGKPRVGDLHQTLVSLGWRVCSIDTMSPKPTNLLDDAVWGMILEDLSSSFYDALWLATPCETFSPLRGQGPGPRPVRSVQHIAGLPKKDLSPAEQKQVRESNILISRTAAAIGVHMNKRKPWGMENPKHLDDKPSLWQVPSIEAISKKAGVNHVDFDQCRVGLETRKPSELAGLECNHPPVEQTDSKGKKYMAPHPSPAGRWRVLPDGTKERASKALGEYTAELSILLANAFHKTQSGSKWLSAELNTEELPWNSQGAHLPRPIREIENDKALGGMRNPHRAVEKQPKARELGKVIRQLLERIVNKWPEITSTAMAILEGNEAKPWSTTLTQLARRLTLKVMDKPSNCRRRPPRPTHPCLPRLSNNGAFTPRTPTPRWLPSGSKRERHWGLGTPSLPQAFSQRSMGHNGKTRLSGLCQDPWQAGRIIRLQWRKLRTYATSWTTTSREDSATWYPPRKMPQKSSKDHPSWTSLGWWSKSRTE